jgi:hypothetical protein
MINKHITFQRNKNIVSYFFQSSPKNPKKLIGTIDLAYSILYIKINNPNEEYNSSKLIGINNEVLKLIEYDYIEVQFGNRFYETTRIFFNENSTFKIMPGNETQKLMKLDLFGMDKVEEWEWIQIKKINKVVNY